MPPKRSMQRKEKGPSLQTLKQRLRQKIKAKNDARTGQDKDEFYKQANVQTKKDHRYFTKHFPTQAVDQVFQQYGMNDVDMRNAILAEVKNKKASSIGDIGAIITKHIHNKAIEEALQQHDVRDSVVIRRVKKEVNEKKSINQIGKIIEKHNKQRLAELAKKSQDANVL